MAPFMNMFGYAEKYDPPFRPAGECELERRPQQPAQSHTNA
jgi:hypothetical protein